MANKYRPLPNHIQKYAFDFHWDNQLVWELTVQPEQMNVDELVWHLNVPWLHSAEGRFDVTPNEVMAHPGLHTQQYSRTMQADLNYPIDIMFNKGRWLILDGLHRLMKAVDLGETEVTVRKIPRSAVPLIAVD